MYPNLEAEMARKNVTGKDISVTLKKSESTFSLKKRGIYKFYLEECREIRDVFFPEVTIDYLFASSTEKTKKKLLTT